MDDIQIDSATVTRKGVRFKVTRQIRTDVEAWDVTTQNPFTSSMRNTGGGELKITAPTFDAALSTLDRFADRINEIGATLKAADRLLKDTAEWCRTGIVFGQTVVDPG